ncbi:MAG: bifunctional indole-3-glycerol-phosphate synthase TrpC/phosphoribosylanthranilate isomerase TrpF [Gammaproteobacteria bacterium]|jgi:indole-3-glycerol phosphate synthase / phosphoribosylanthranilate isomerase|nr:bifunctional indole-3-glycerol-phosphate synthase TrpC/phosphoribosylanthranilate isomerase TrpF [Gammaproteobacteria bacterium]
MANVLDTIISHKRLELAEMKAQRPLESFSADVRPTSRNFLQALLKPGARFILECKKASPSKGLIRANFDLDEIASVYGQYADCISVLTDHKFFQGSYDYLAQMRQKVQQPLLHKDFIIDPYQIYLGRLYGADAVLLMLSVLDDAQYRLLADIAHQFNMTVLTEVSNEQETFRAVELKAELIGINNRDLRTLDTHLDTSFRLARLIPPGTPLVSESGIHHNHQVRHLRKVAKAFLVGSSLMAQPDLAAAVRSLVLGEHKVCGLTTPEQAVNVEQAGAYFGGLIFYPKSPRFVTMTQAKSIIAAAPLHFVGVFVNEALAQVALVAKELGLAAVQLHGDEDDSYLHQLRELLPKSVQIWKAYRVKDQLPQFSRLPDRILLDSFTPGIPGGTGLKFDWSLLQQQLLQKPVMLAGGLTPENLRAALPLAITGLDMNSGLESAPGVKDPAKIAIAFQQIREFSYD